MNKKQMAYKMIRLMLDELDEQRKKSGLTFIRKKYAYMLIEIACDNNCDPDDIQELKNDLDIPF